ncbi:RNA polymerase sigma factor [Cellulomonas cellasea]|uniref:RNA polymerase sigma-70 factor n=2 Tax=Cellulomonas cellasea TaxID=43670 RepID=A0A0A0B4L3_9CELL|nr:sigma-70 family RNA polymerase sigma factor [Cellulomonas cellasea]KGM01118.1 RNA polymerase sigma-70 factor [Cellulomonas cellasea DSM 20118]GEA87554.1 DNA-directed RNA polymerase sigma-70 factor [Cellulomonas cellasea]
MRRTPRGPDRERTFTALYEAVYPDLLRFVQRRARAEHAEDVVAEAFLVVWRRLDELPRDQDDARAWVFGVARHVLLNADRGEHRRRALGVRLASAGPHDVSDAPADGVVDRLDLSRAWAALPDAHQEVLALAVLDGVTGPQAAAVLGITPVAFRLRLSRARRVLRQNLDHEPQRATTPAGLTGRTTP